MRNARRGALLREPILRDLRYAVRSLRRDLGASVFAIAIAGLGIGASTTVFGLCQALLRRPLPLRDPERLVWIANGATLVALVAVAACGGYLPARRATRVDPALALKPR